MYYHFFNIFLSLKNNRTDAISLSLPVNEPNSEGLNNHITVVFVIILKTDQTKYVLCFLYSEDILFEIQQHEEGCWTHGEENSNGVGEIQGETKAKLPKSWAVWAAECQTHTAAWALISIVCRALREPTAWYSARWKRTLGRGSGSKLQLNSNASLLPTAFLPSVVFSGF